MKCLLLTVDGPAAGKSISIKTGQTVTVGRSNQAAFVIPDDPLLSSVHFSVKCMDGSCVIQDLGSTNKTFVNDQCITRAELKTGDIVNGGNSSFEVTLEQEDRAVGKSGVVEAESGPTAATSPPVAARATPETLEVISNFVAPRAADVLRRFSLNDEPFQSAGDASPRELVERLWKQGKLTEAVKFIAYALPKRCAVWWASQCVRAGSGESLKPEEVGPLAAAEAWAADPTEENRRAAMAASETLGHSQTPCWPAIGAFWSSGSMGPPTAPPIPPADDLTGKAVFGAVQLAAVAQEPEKAPQKLSQFIELALAIERSEKTWKQKAS